MKKPVINPQFVGRQLVDGNYYFLNRFQTEAGGMVIRNIVRDIIECATPPIFCFDPSDGNLRRRALVPEYKVRSEKEKSGRENLWPSLQLMRSLMPLVPCVCLTVPTYEADDALASLALSHDGPVRVVTGDRDLAQLSVHANIEVTSGYDDIAPEDIRLYKTLVGDPSDKIKGIPGFGPKSWEKLNKALVTDMDFDKHNPDSLNMGMTHWLWACQNKELLEAYYSIVGLFSIPMSDIAPHIKVGTNNPAKVNAILQEFML